MAGMGSRAYTNADDSCALLRRVVENALAHFVVEMRAVVVGFYGGALRVVRVGVEGVEVRAYPLDGGEILVLKSVRSLELS